SGGEVVQHERPFIHLWQESGLDESPQPESDKNQRERRDDDPADMVQDRAERPFIARPKRLERNLCPREYARSGGLDLVGGHKLLGEQRNDRQRRSEEHTSELQS